ncbi:MAG TPA: response regulator [Hyphomicrobiaceae bacterium]|nr:response regulator [Hyphomicrobiaceae bacterium]
MSPLNSKDTSEGSLQGLRALVVEDHRPAAQALASALTDLGVEVVGPAATSVEAEHLTKARSPNLALVDLNLDGEEAVGLIQWLLKSKLRVIVMSGLALPPNAISNDIHFLQKPFSGDELLAALNDSSSAAA